MPVQLQTLSFNDIRPTIRKQQELIERHALRLICLGIATLSLAGLLYLTQASAITTTTYEIQELQRKQQRLQRTRDRLRAEIAALTSPEHVKAQARALGFRESSPAEFLAVNEIPMVVQQSLASTPEEGPPAPLEVLLTRTSHWLRTAMTLLPAPQQVEAGPAHP